jgi:hypothetical protein
MTDGFSVEVGALHALAAQVRSIGRTVGDAHSGLDGLDEDQTGDGDRAAALHCFTEGACIGAVCRRWGAMSVYGRPADCLRTVDDRLDRPHATAPGPPARRAVEAAHHQAAPDAVLEHRPGPGTQGGPGLPDPIEPPAEPNEYGDEHVHVEVDGPTASNPSIVLSAHAVGMTVHVDLTVPGASATAALLSRAAAEAVARRDFSAEAEETDR